MSHTESWTERLLLLLAVVGRQSGQTLAEYALMLAIVLVASVMAVTAIALTTNSYFTDFVGGLG